MIFLLFCFACAAALLIMGKAAPTIGTGVGGCVATVIYLPFLILFAPFHLLILFMYAREERQNRRKAAAEAGKVP